MLIRLTYLWVTCILLFSCDNTGSTNDHQAGSRIDPTITFTKKEYTQDLQQLLRIIKTTHPAYKEWTTVEELDNLVEDIIELNLSDSLSIGQFIWLCRGLVAEMGCGHSTVPTIGSRIQMKDSYLFPMKVAYIGDRLFVIDPLVNGDVADPGDEILSIQSLPVSEIKLNLSSAISTDGFNKSHIQELINDEFMLYMSYWMNFEDEYELELAGKGYVKLKQLESFDESPSSTEGNLTYSFDESTNTAIITIRSFYYYNNNFPTFKKFIDQSFSKIKEDNAEHLIVDLRDNGGGDPYCGAYLLRHLATESFSYYRKDGPQEYNDLKGPLELSKNRFLGKPIVLINGKCFSTTGAVTAIMKSHKMAVMIGQDTGASYACNATVRQHRLNQTGISAFIATRSFEAAVDNLPKDEGVHPDILTKPTIQDLLDNKDVEMERAFEYIKAN